MGTAHRRQRCPQQAHLRILTSWLYTQNGLEALLKLLLGTGPLNSRVSAKNADLFKGGALAAAVWYNYVLTDQFYCTILTHGPAAYFLGAHEISRWADH
jgi:hypothetical protein